MQSNSYKYNTKNIIIMIINEDKKIKTKYKFNIRIVKIKYNILINKLTTIYSTTYS